MMWVVIAPLALWLLIKLWLLPRYGNYTIGCLLFRQHDACDQHLRCGCPHHDVIIHQEMTKQR